MRLYEEIKGSAPLSVALARFQNTLIAVTCEIVGAIARDEGLQTVCLSGGCFQNAALLSGVYEGIRAKGLTPLIHRALPPNDECVAYGQTLIAAACRDRLSDENAYPVVEW